MLHFVSVLTLYSSILFVSVDIDFALTLRSNILNVDNNNYDNITAVKILCAFR